VWKISTTPPKRVTVDSGARPSRTGRRGDGAQNPIRPLPGAGADFGEEIERRAADAKLILDTAAKHGVPWKCSEAERRRVDTRSGA
jgi:hypothetical protein